MVSAVHTLDSAGSERAQRNVAGALNRLGVRPGERIVLSADASPDYVSVVLGATRSGVVPVPLDPRLTASERDAIINDVEPALIVDDSFADLLAGPESDLATWPQCRPMHFTSGTTGRPKGVWSGLLTPDHARSLAHEERDVWGFGSDDRNLVVSPIYHSAPLRFAAGTLLAGGSVGFLPSGSFDPASFAETLESWQPTTMFCVPAHLQRLFAWMDETGGVIRTASLRLLAHAGAPCPDVVRERAHEVFGTDVVWEFYGSTEGQWTACPATSWQDHRGTVGRARPGRVVSADSDGQLWCAVPPWATFEYWRDPEKTAAAWKDTPDGPAFTVGDLGRVEDGWVYLESRRTDLIITGGVNVYPAEVESILSAAPGVADIAVFGRPDDRWGQRVCAAYVGDADEAVLRAMATERLSPPKRPKEYVHVEALPRTATGKVKRRELTGD